VEQFLQYTVVGLVTAAIYAVLASGLVVTYTTSGIFNFAHGAVAMMAAFCYWQLSVEWDVPVPLSVALILVVLAPAFGLLLDRVVMRGLEGTSDVIKTVVTVGVLFALIALAQIVWGPNVNRIVEPFFGAKSKVEIFGVSVLYHQLLVIVVAAAVAFGLRLLLFNTRTGVAMRAVVSNRDLVRLNGGRPSRASAASWALGSSLAALSGILIAYSVGSLAVLPLTLLVLNAYAAAIVGRLVNLPMTFLGAVILGLAQAYAVGYLPENPSWLPDGIDLVASLRISIPIIILFVVLLVLPQAPLRAHGLVRVRESVPRPGVRSSLLGAGLLVAAAAVLSTVLDTTGLASWGKAFAFALIMLSLVPLTGYGGQISLAQMAFAGLGAYAMGVWGGGGNPVGLVAAFVLPAVVGAIVALPALRLRGIYLALSTLAFAVFMDRVVFSQDKVFPSGSRTIDRLELGPIHFTSDRSYFVLLAVVFAIAGLGVVRLRLGPFGRRLQAMKDSPAACATLGVNLTSTKMQVFALSAGIAGVGGAMLGGLQKGVSVTQFDALQSLPILLMAAAGGIAMVSGALAGGIFYASFPIIAEAIPSLRNLLQLAPGLIGVSLGRNPNGAMNDIASRWQGVRAQLDGSTGLVDTTPPLEPVGPLFDAECIGVDRDFTPADVELIDRVLGFDDEEVAGVAPRG
jgi:branched-chain amino acid transport system permease protein